MPLAHKICNMGRTLVRNALVITLDQNWNVFRGSVLIEADKISAVGQDISSLPEDCVIDAGGQWLLPGFVQTHIHLCQSGFRSQAEDLELLEWLEKKIWPLEAALTPRKMRWAAKIGVMECLLGGTTTILDMGSVYYTEEIFKIIEESGIRAFAGKTMMDMGPSVPRGLLEDTEKSLIETESLIKNWHGAAKGRIRYALAPRFVLSCSERLWKTVLDMSRTDGLLIHTHCCENRRETEAAQQILGCGTIEFFSRLGLLSDRLLLAHCLWLEDEEMRELADTGTRVLHCPSSNLKLASGIAKVPEMLDLGICASLGADGASCNNNLDIFQEMRLAGLIQKIRGRHLSAKTIVQMATISGARALGLEKEIGSIEVGKKADLLLLDPFKPHMIPFSEEDPYTALVYCAHSSDVESVFVDGQLVVNHRKVLTLDEEDLYKGII